MGLIRFLQQPINKLIQQKCLPAPSNADQGHNLFHLERYVNLSMGILWKGSVLKLSDK